MAALRPTSRWQRFWYDRRLKRVLGRRHGAFVETLLTIGGLAVLIPMMLVLGLLGILTRPLRSTRDGGCFGPGLGVILAFAALVGVVWLSSWLESH
jgi:hypothetical protein